MPYHLIKVTRGFKVEDDKGRTYSNKPLTKKNATAQMKALYASAYHGGNITSYVDDDGHHMLIHGSGFITDIFAKAKKATLGAVSSVFRKAASIVGAPIRNNYPPKARHLLAKYAKAEVDNVIIRREPIVGLINTALNFISLGKWNEVRDKLNYDKLFHLSMVVQLRNPNGYLLVEKNEVINITDKFKMNSDRMEYMVIPVPIGVNFWTFMTKAQQLKGDDFFKYDAFTNNCQMFIDGILNANGINSPEAQAFIMQNVDDMLEDLPEFVSPFAQLTTNIAGLANRVLEGEGMGGTNGHMVGEGVETCPDDPSKIRMPRKEYLEEHKRLIALLERISKGSMYEAKKQRKEIYSQRKGKADDLEGGKGGNDDCGGSNGVMKALEGSGKKNLNMFELFKGTGSIGKVASKMGFNVVSLDFDPIYTPDIETDILKWDYKGWAEENKFIPDYIWASPPCNTYSVLAYPLKERDTKTAESKSARAKEGTAILHRTLEIIKYFQSKNPKMLYTVENPRGMMRHDKVIKKLPNRETTLYCLYGDFKRKPTDFWSNFPMNLKPHTEKCRSKKVVANLADLPTIEQRYSIPGRLVRKILTEAKEAYGDEPMMGAGFFGDKRILKFLDAMSKKKGGALSLKDKEKMAEDRKAFQQRLSAEAPAGSQYGYQAAGYDPSEGGTKEPCWVYLALDNKEGGLNRRQTSMGYKTPEECAAIQKAQNDESRRRQYNNMTPFQKFAQGFLDVVTPIADVASNIIPGVSGQIYQQFAPPGSAYYSGSGNAQETAAAADHEFNRVLAAVERAVGRDNALIFRNRMEPLRAAVMNAIEQHSQLYQRSKRSVKTGKKTEASLRETVGQRDQRMSQILRDYQRQLYQNADNFVERVHAESRNIVATRAAAKTEEAGFKPITDDSDEEGAGKPRGGGSDDFFGLSNAAYLRRARAAAKAAGYDPRKLQLAKDGKHKLAIVADDGRVVRFGKLGMKDFILWKHTEPAKADARRKNYLARATKIKGDWASDKFSPNSLAIKILWT
jgi:site-specific DNA-cytosine methylase